MQQEGACEKNDTQYKDDHEWYLSGVEHVDHPFEQLSLKMSLFDFDVQCEAHVCFGCCHAASDTFPHCIFL